MSPLRQRDVCLDNCGSRMTFVSAEGEANLKFRVIGTPRLKLLVDPICGVNVLHTITLPKFFTQFPKHSFQSHFHYTHHPPPPYLHPEENIPSTMALLGWQAGEPFGISICTGISGSVCLAGNMGGFTQPNSEVGRRRNVLS